jgi:hypothetical protein
LSAVIAKNTPYNRKNTDSIVINVADWKTCKKRLLAVKYLIWIIYKYQNAKTKTLYISTDGPPGQLAEKPAKFRWIETFPSNHVRIEGLGVVTTCRANWWMVRLSSDSDRNPQWCSRTVSNTSCCSFWLQFVVFHQPYSHCHTCSSVTEIDTRLLSPLQGQLH